MALITVTLPVFNRFLSPEAGFWEKWGFGADPVKSVIDLNVSIVDRCFGRSSFRCPGRHGVF